METTEAESVSDSYEFINDGDAKSLKTDIHVPRTSALTTGQRCSSLDSGVPLNRGETTLAKRVRHLQQENHELRRTVQDNDEVLELCVNNLNTWKVKQEINCKDLVEKHGKAAKKVKKLLEENGKLEEKIKIYVSAAENTKTNANSHSIQQCNRLECLEEENASLKLMMSVLKTNVGSLHEHLKQIMNSSNSDYQKFVSPDSSFFQDLVEVCVEVEGSIDLVANLKGPVTHQQLNIVSTLQEELKIVKAKCNDLEKALEDERVKRSIRERQADQMQLGGCHYNNPQETGVKELKDEVHLLEMSVEKMDMVRTGYVSHGSEATEEGFSVNKGDQFESFESVRIHNFEEERRGYMEKIEELERDKVMYDREATVAIGKREEALERNKTLEQQLRSIEDEKLLIENELQDMTAKNEKLENEIKEENNVKLRLVEEYVEKQRVEHEKSSQLHQDQLHHEIAILKSQVCTFHQEIQENEKESDQMQARMVNMELRFAKRDDELKLKESALLETRNEMQSVYSQNETLIAENQLCRGYNGAELSEYKSKIDSLTAQLLGAEEMVENKEQDYRKLQHDHANVTSELETVPLLKQQIDLFQVDFETERQNGQKLEEECKRLREELIKLRNENEQLVEEANDPTGSRMAEMRRRHGTQPVGNSPDEATSTWNGFYDRFLAPRGAVGRNYVSPHSQIDSDLNRQVSGGRCPKCDRMFPDLDTLQTHVVECLESDTLGTGERVCPKCQESFPDLDTLQIHVMECLDK